MTTALVVMAKAPVAGFAKTRLIPALGAARAGRLAECMLQHALHISAGLGAQHTELCVTPHQSSTTNQHPSTGEHLEQHPAFTRALDQAMGRLVLTQQGEGDLGERMNRVFERLLRTHQKVLLIGTDAPGLTTCQLQQSQALLDAHEAVFIPTLDGGYALVGLTRPVPAFFLNMTWSTSTVMHETRLRANSHQVTWIELEPVADIDEAADLIHVPADWSY